MGANKDGRQRKAMRSGIGYDRIDEVEYEEWEASREEVEGRGSCNS